MNSYKDQFKEWSPAYPVIFHGAFAMASERNFNGKFINVTKNTLKTHNITIKAINKAMSIKLKGNSDEC